MADRLDKALAREQKTRDQCAELMHQWDESEEAADEDK